MVNRIHNRNPGYSENIFKSPNVEPNPINSIDGATALKLDEQLEIDTKPSNISHSSLGQETIEKASTGNDISSQGISMENASYIESNLEINNLENNITSEEYTPKLFSEDNIYESDEEKAHNDNLFDQNSSEEEEFEIPAFLRKQKF